MLIAKMKGKIVQIVRVTENVLFSDHKNWVLICFDFEKPMRNRTNIRWMLASETYFEWVREFIGE